MLHLQEEAYRCPDRIPQVQVTDLGLTVDGLVGEKHTTMLLDSGAELTLVPPKLVRWSPRASQDRQRL